MKFKRWLVNLVRACFAGWVIWAVYWLLHPLIVGRHSVYDSLMIYDGLLNLSTAIIGLIIFVGWRPITRTLWALIKRDKKVVVPWGRPSKVSKSRGRSPAKRPRGRPRKDGQPAGSVKAAVVPKKIKATWSAKVKRKKIKFRIPGFLFAKRFLAVLLVIFYFVIGEMSLTTNNGAFAVMFLLTSYLLFDYVWKTRAKARAREGEKDAE